MPPLPEQPDMAEGTTAPTSSLASMHTSHFSDVASGPLTVVLPPSQGTHSIVSTMQPTTLPAMAASSTIVGPMPSHSMAGGAMSGPPMVTYSMGIDDIPPPKADFSAPPPYELATKLPTYEEVQREKTLQGEIPRPGPSTPRAPVPMFLAIDTDPNSDDTDTSLLGTDFMFFTAFIVAFLFNWIGFLLLLCFCHTIAARYGALAGFGLSLAKWTLIVKHSTDLLASRENNWLWWLLMTLGLLICVRAIIQYLNIKRGWRLLSGNAQERLMFFY